MFEKNITVGFGINVHEKVTNEKCEFVNIQ